MFRQVAFRVLVKFTRAASELEEQADGETESTPTEKDASQERGFSTEYPVWVHLNPVVELGAAGGEMSPTGPEDIQRKCSGHTVDESEFRS